MYYWHVRVDADGDKTLYLYAGFFMLLPSGAPVAASSSDEGISAFPGGVPPIKAVAAAPVQNSPLVKRKAKPDTAAGYVYRTARKQGIRVNEALLEQWRRSHPDVVERQRARQREHYERWLERQRRESSPASGAPVHVPLVPLTTRLLPDNFNAIDAENAPFYASLAAAPPSPPAVVPPVDNSDLEAEIMGEAPAVDNVPDAEGDADFESDLNWDPVTGGYFDGTY
jgi:hypothetical protein